MEEFFIVSKIIHISAGSIALLTGLMAILLRKKIKLHKSFGLVYFWCMTIIFISSTLMSVYKFHLFLFCLGFFTYYSCITAYRSLKLKKLHLEQKPSKLDWFIEIVFGLMHISFITFALMLLLKGNISFGIVSLVFGCVGLLGNYNTIKRFKKKLIYKNYWLLAHIGGMLGSYIGAITAFLVNNGRLFPVPQIVLWLGPTVILVPFIVYEIRRQKKLTKLF